MNRGRQGSGSCKGYCYNVVVEMMRDPERMADILDFASEQERGVVACAHGTHRSVAAGQVRPSWGQDAPCWLQVGPCWGQVGPT